MHVASLSEHCADFPCNAPLGATADLKSPLSAPLPKQTYEKIFYRHLKRRGGGQRIYGFPMLRGAWCNSNLKRAALRRQQKKFFDGSLAQGAKKNIVQYLGIAADEPERIKRHTKPGIMLPLVEMGWDEAYCRQLCEENGLLSPIYTTASRGGCWFCHNQSVDQLRLLRKNYPDLWALLLKWDADSPVSFKPDGHTVHDYDRRFFAEDLNLVPSDRRFRWKMLEEDEVLEAMKDYAPPIVGSTTLGAPKE